MARLRYDFLSNTLGATLGSGGGDTTVTFSSALTEFGSNIPTITGSDFIVLICDNEIMYLTAYTSGATTGTVTRAQEGSVIASHSPGTKIYNGPTSRDLYIEPEITKTSSSPANLSIAIGATSTIDTINLSVTKPSIITLFAFNTMHGNTGTAATAGNLFWVDNATSTTIGDVRWHTNGLERQVQVSVSAFSVKASAGTHTFLFRASNDAGSAQAMTSRDAIITANVIGLALG